MLDCDSAGVEEDEGDDEPEPVGRLADSPDEKAEVLLFLPRLLVGLRLVSCGKKYTWYGDLTQHFCTW